MSFVVLDTETTGLGADAAVVEIAVVDADGQVLLDTLVNPGCEIPDEATAIHGITDVMVADAPTVEEALAMVERVVAGRHVVIYNAAYDTRLLPVIRTAAALITCAMRRFSILYGDWSEYHGNYRWKPLGKAAAHCGHAWEGLAHRALSDALAARTVWLWCETHEAEILDRRAQQAADAALRWIEDTQRQRFWNATPAWVSGLLCQRPVVWGKHPEGCICLRCMREDAQWALTQKERERSERRTTQRRQNREQEYQAQVQRLLAGESGIQFGSRWPTDLLMTRTDARKTLRTADPARLVPPRASGVTNRNTGGLNPLWLRAEVEAAAECRK